MRYQVKIGPNVEIEHEGMPPASLASYPNGIERRFSGSISERVWMKVFLQIRLQISFDDRLSHAIRHRRHGCIELHIGPVSLWDRPRSLIPFIPFEVVSLSC